jgi:hypothetical protein
MITVKHGSRQVELLFEISMGLQVLFSHAFRGNIFAERKARSHASPFMPTMAKETYR